MALPYHAIPGNMDTGNKHAAVQGACYDDLADNVTSDHLSRFADYFGAFPWSFIHRNVRFTGFYAAVAGSGLPEEAVLWDFLEKLPTLTPAATTIVLMHYALFIDEMDEPNFDLTSADQYIPRYFCIDHAHR